MSSAGCRQRANRASAAEPARLMLESTSKNGGGSPRHEGTAPRFGGSCFTEETSPFPVQRDRHMRCSLTTHDEGEGAPDDGDSRRRMCEIAHPSSRRAV